MKIIVLFVCLTISGTVVETMRARPKRDGGNDSIPIESAPHFVSLRRAKEHVCGGAFIGRRHVLTAAHCIVDEFYRPLFDTRVVSGTDIINRAEEEQSIKKISAHEDFRHESSSYDIAVITLWMHVEWNEKRQKIALPSTEPWYFMMPRLTAFKSRLSKYRLPGLKQISVKITIFGNPSLSGRTFRGSIGNRQSIGIVDSGGPLDYNNTLVGIVAKTPENNKHACIFVSVVKFKTFIEKFIGNERPPVSERPSVIVWAPKCPRL